MTDNTIEIRDEEINVEKIMEKIRDNIRRRQTAGELPPNSDSVIVHTSKNSYSGKSDNAIDQDLSYINSNWDIHNNSYYISSHHPYIGKFLIKGRQLVHGEIRRYIDPVISRQTNFNANAVRTINRLSKQYSELKKSHENLEAKINEYPSIIKKEVATQIGDYIHARASVARVLEERMQRGMERPDSSRVWTSEKINYFLFEEQFRGSRDDIKERQLKFLPYFEKCSRVLDIGCGRGEFLENLKNYAINGIGVDSDPDMVAYCRSQHLDVEQADAIAFLETLEDKSLDGIFIDQVVEHMESGNMIRLIALCYQKMKPGSWIIIETVNPLSFTSLANFNIDMTHIKPVHPETLQYLLNVMGFRDFERKFFGTVPEENTLKKINVAPQMNDTERNNIEIYNQNIDRLNVVLFGAQDYAVIGKK